MEKWTKCYIPLFPKKSYLGITKKYRGTTCTSIAAEVYNVQLLNRIQPEIERVLTKDQKGFFTFKQSDGEVPVMLEL